MHDTNRVTNKTKTKLQILKRCAIRHPVLTSDNTLMVRCCTNVCLLPTKTCESLFKKRGNNTDLEELVGSKQCYYIMFIKQCEWRREIKKLVVKWYQRSRKQWPFKAFGSFKEVNCMNEYLLNDSVFIFVRTK